MKWVIIMLFMLLTVSNVKSQTTVTDSLKYEITAIKEAMQHHAAKFRSGSDLLGIGVIVSISGTYLATQKWQTEGLILSLAGSCLMGIGGYKMIRSHRYLNISYKYYYKGIGIGIAMRF